MGRMLLGLHARGGCFILLIAPDFVAAAALIDALAFSRAMQWRHEGLDQPPADASPTAAVAAASTVSNRAVLVLVRISHFASAATAGAIIAETPATVAVIVTASVAFDVAAAAFYCSGSNRDRRRRGIAHAAAAQQWLRLK